MPIWTKYDIIEIESVSNYNSHGLRTVRDRRGLKNYYWEYCNNIFAIRFSILNVALTVFKFVNEEAQGDLEYGVAGDM